MVYDTAMDKSNAPTDRVWAIWVLYAQDFPVTISLDQRSQDDNLPYRVVVGESEEQLCRLSDQETSWLIQRKVGVR